MEAKARNSLTREEKKLILVNHEVGKSYSEIAGILRRSKSVFYSVSRIVKVDKTLKPKPRTSRPPMTTKREDRMIVKMSLKNRLIQQRIFLVHFVNKQESQFLEKMFLVG